MQIIVKNMALVCVSALLPYGLQQLMDPGILRFFTVCSLSVATTFVSFWFLALSRVNREMVKSKVSDKFKRKR